jgi:purine-nucleoside/S-methyl-5'-thioadenosine phosphorylase / adenosine deaminase
LTQVQTVRSIPQSIHEEPAAGDAPVLLNRDWAVHHPWLVQGITWRGPSGDFDLGLFGAGAVGDTLSRWRHLCAALGFDACVHARQVHGTRIIDHETRSRGLLVAGDADGHATATLGLLLTVSVADCIPISFADPANRRIAIVHAGWRGVVAGAPESAISTLVRSGSRPADLICHLGPAICAACYEVGPEVHERLGLDRPAGNLPVDLREIARKRIIAAGVPSAGLSVSGWCPRCVPDRFFSHRAGSSGRQMGFIGIRSHPTD